MTTWVIIVQNIKQLPCQPANANYFIIRTIAQNSIIYISLHQSEVAPALSFA